MIILRDLNTKYNHRCNIALGVFDGLHLGHQLIFKRLNQKEGKSIVITFSNHPIEILKSNSNFSPIYSLEEKLNLLENFGVDIVVLIKFTKAFANINYIDFIAKLKSCFPFNYLVVGEDVKIGKDKKGDKTKIKSLENFLNFKAEFIKKVKYQDKIISSSWIRSLIKEKKYDLVELLLNRSYKNKEMKCQKNHFQPISLVE